MEGLAGGRDARPGAAAEQTAGWQRDRAEAFALFDDARLARGFRLATLVLRDADEAEDAMQEAIARAWASWPTLRDRDRFDAWFDRILVNVCRNRLRHVRRIMLVPLDDAAELSDETSEDAILVRHALEPAFARLSPDHRIVLVLRFWQDLSVEQIADRLGVPPGTVKSRLHYALKAIREAIESLEAKP